MSEKNEYKDLEQEMSSYPKLKLDEAAKKQIHQRIMEEADLQEQRQQRGDKMKRIYVGLSSAAVIILAVGLAYSFKDGNELNHGSKDLSHEQGDSGQEDQGLIDQNQVADGEEETRITDVYSEYEEAFTKEIASIEITVDAFKPNKDLKRYTTTDPELITQFIGTMKTMKIDKTRADYDSKNGYELFIKLFDKDKNEVFEIMLIENTDVVIINSVNNSSSGPIRIVESNLQSFLPKLIKDKYLTENQLENILIERSKEIVLALKEKKMHSLAENVHESKGLLFSPYVYIHEDALTFQSNEITRLLDEPSVYTWGVADGSGFPIELTALEYFDHFVYDANYLETQAVFANYKTQRGTMINNIEEVFPQSQVIEFFVEGTEEYYGMNWTSLSLVYQLNEEGNYKLVAIVHNQWTT